MDKNFYKYYKFNYYIYFFNYIIFFFINKVSYYILKFIEFKNPIYINFDNKIIAIYYIFLNKKNINSYYRLFLFHLSVYCNLHFYTINIKKI